MLRTSFNFTQQNYFRKKLKSRNLQKLDWSKALQNIKTTLIIRGAGIGGLKRPSNEPFRHCSQSISRFRKISSNFSRS